VGVGEGFQKKMIVTWAFSRRRKRILKVGGRGSGLEREGPKFGRKVFEKKSNSPGGRKGGGWPDQRGEENRRGKSNKKEEKDCTREDQGVCIPKVAQPGSRKMNTGNRERGQTKSNEREKVGTFTKT